MKLGVAFRFLVIIFFGGLMALGLYLSTVDMAAFIVTEILAFSGLVAAVIFHRKLVKPYRILNEGMNLLREQDFSSRLRPIPSGEAGRLVEVFNKMMEQLREQRLSVREQNRFLDLLIEASPQGYIILDMDYRITSTNPAALKLLRIADREKVVGLTLDRADFEHRQASRALGDGQSTIITDAGISSLRCSRSSFMNRGFSYSFIMIEEMSGELRRAERKSYENIIRLMAHEVNNSIGAVSSTLGVISDALCEQIATESTRNSTMDIEDVLPAVRASLVRCENLARFTDNFAAVVKIPDPVKTPVDLCRLITNVADLSFSAARSRDVYIHIEIPRHPVMAMIDAAQMEQVLLNIVKNAYESIVHRGDVWIRVSEQPLSIAVIDNGRGIDPLIEKKLFTPFFTTKADGQGVGLMFVREILYKHGFQFKLSTRDALTTFTIFFNAEV